MNMKSPTNIVRLPTFAPSGRRRPIDPRDFERFRGLRSGLHIAAWLFLVLTSWWLLYLLYLYLVLAVAGPVDGGV